MGIYSARWTQSLASSLMLCPVAGCGVLAYPCRLLSATYNITGLLKDQAELVLHLCQGKAATSLSVSVKLLKPYTCMFADNPAATSISIFFSFLIKKQN